MFEETHPLPGGFLLGADRNYKAPHRDVVTSKSQLYQDQLHLKYTNWKITILGSEMIFEYDDIKH